MRTWLETLVDWWTGRDSLTITERKKLAWGSAEDTTVTPPRPDSGTLHLR